jgi:hypothetical protein
MLVRASGNLGFQTAPDFFDRMDRMGGMEELVGFVAANASHLPGEGRAQRVYANDGTANAALCAPVPIVSVPA